MGVALSCSQRVGSKGEPLKSKHDILNGNRTSHNHRNIPVEDSLDELHSENGDGVFKGGLQGLSKVSKERTQRSNTDKYEDKSHRNGQNSDKYEYKRENEINGLNCRR